MGNYLHVAKKYDVEYTDSYPLSFNWKIYEFHRLLDALGICYTGEVDDDDFECDTKDWFDGMEKLKNMHTLDKEEFKNIKHSLDTLEANPLDVYNTMEMLLNASDPNNCEIHLSFF